MEEITQIIRETSSMGAQELLKWSAEKFPGIVFATSFGAEDMILLDLICKLKLPIEVITLDTGRLPKETYALMERCREKYQIPIKTYFPDQQKVEEMVNQKGFYSFQESIENRKECCRFRKIESLRRALQGKAAWITGLRKSQSVTREEMQKVESDNFFGNIIKINPLRDWSEEEVWGYLKENNVPYNTLHDQGYPSIGCEPCTRAIKPGEDVRAGRWWWENPEQKECGLHRYNNNISDNKIITDKEISED